MNRRIIYCSMPLMIVLFIFLNFNSILASFEDQLILEDTTDKRSIYPATYMIKDRAKRLTIDDVLSNSSSHQFLHSSNVEQQGGFFETVTWLRFEVRNESNQKEWLLEFAFPLIYQLDIYTEEQSTWTKLHTAGTNFPFNEREINHRNFIFNLEIDPGESKTFYVAATGGGDLHPPINIWRKDAFTEKSQDEFLMLGTFYGVILAMILYNLFLFFSLRMKSYLYYVLVITCTLMGKLSINGLGYQYIWSNYPGWNLISTPFWVSLACLFILIFTRNFLDVDTYIPRFKYVSYGLMVLNGLVLVILPFSHYTSLHLMIAATFSTFATVLLCAVICLRRGARQARFYIIGWVVFLTGVCITILVRAVVLPYAFITEYAGQIALSAEVILLSFALADKIKIIRAEKEIAERKAKESQALAMENLKKADKLKDEFLAVTSHELRTPLYGMIGITESLRDGIAGEVSREMDEQLSLIITSGNRLTHLVNDILDFSKLKHDSLDLEKKIIHVHGVIDTVIAVSKQLLKNKRVKLIKNVDAMLPPLYADENRLQQILYNLLDNAIKYTNEGEIVVSATTEKNSLILTVSDTGKGIPNHQLSNIFNAFHQGDPSLSRNVQGTGIGLSITKRLVALHDGKLDVESEVGSGSTFIVTLPTTKKLDAIVQQVEEVALTTESIEFSIVEGFQPYKENNARYLPRILIADDEAVNLQVLVNQLTLEGYDVSTAMNGKEVLQIIKKQPPDLLILDIMMPQMSGYEVCQQLRKKYTLMELPILMLTAKNQIHDKVVSFDVGANDYVVKPCDKQELISRVKTLVRMRNLNKEIIEINMHLEDKVYQRTEALKATNLKLQQKNEELVEMSASRQRLLANIAHELGTPVTLIHSYMQSLQQGLVTVDDEHYNELIRNTINILNRLISDLFDLSTLEAGEKSMTMRAVHLDDWLNNVLNRCEFTVVQANRIFKRPKLPSYFKKITAVVDIERMDQVFSNLASNAIKNTEENNGCISIAFDIDERADSLYISIKDNGYGIKEEDLPFIFNRFYKGTVQMSEQKQQAGAGLGLAIVKEIIDRHNGSIRAQSIVNTGTTFSIKLPIKK
ncbi:ATP-binding protein [Virgibacillus sp. W0430]|uniref:ATP-binding protein n=1 Tax=Virgibacillus sp. W0430 TaxID=3391580 RepID=UPI003F48A76D